MSNTIQLKRRTSGPAAAPAVLATGEPAYNEVNNVLYIGRSDGSIVTVGGKGAFLELNTNQTAAADYTFSGTVDFTGTIELDGTEITATAAELNTLDGVTASTTELNYLAGVTPGTGTASKALVLDASSNVTVGGTIYVNSNKEVATKEYVDATKQGLDVKDSVRVATTANITLSGLQTIDGVTVVAGDRVLVKNQTTASQNGIYVAAAGAWSRATDADASADVTAGMYAFVSEGTTQADSGWVLTTNDAITLGTTALNFTQFSGAGQITAGDGLTKNGNTLNVAGTSGRIVANADSIDLATVGVAPGTYGSVTVDAYGRVTAGSADVDGGTYA